MAGSEAGEPAAEGKTAGGPDSCGCWGLASGGEEAAEEEEEVVLACEPPQVPSGGLPIMLLAAPAQPSQTPWPASGPSRRRPDRALAAGLGSPSRSTARR